jgi:hypothetical protein
MKTLEDIRNEISGLKYGREVESHSMVIFFGGEEEKTFILFQSEDKERVVKIMEDNSDLVEYFTIKELGKTFAFKGRGETVTKYRNI